jgi:hypothetical protein
MSSLAQTIVDELRSEPRQFAEVVDRHRDVSWPDFLKAWGEVRSMETLGRDDDGRYLIKSGSTFRA